MDKTSHERRHLVLLVLFFEGSLLGLAWVLGWSFNEHPLEHWSWNLSDAMVGISSALPLLVVFFAILRWPVGPLARIKRVCDDIVRPLFAPCSLPDLGAIALAAGISEELLFRGVLQPALARGLGPWWALAATSALFGLLHPITATYAIIAGVFGLYLGSVFLLTGNLAIVVIAHAVYDFAALVYLTRRAVA